MTSIDYTNRQSLLTTNQSGFTLLEMMVAFAVLVTGLSAAMAFNAAALMAGEDAWQRVQALHLASSLLEQMQDETDPAATRWRDGRYQDNPAYAGPAFRREWTVATSTLTPQLKSLHVTVRWRDRAGLEQAAGLSREIRIDSPRTLTHDLQLMMDAAATPPRDNPWFAAFADPTEQEP